MKKSAHIVFALHMILWVIILLISVVMRFTYSAPEMDPLDFELSKGVYNAFIIVASLGIINAAILFFSLRAVSSVSGEKHKRQRIVAFCLSLIATILFYSSAILIFIINSDILLVLPVAWLLCELCCGVMFAVSKER